MSRSSVQFRPAAPLGIIGDSVRMGIDVKFAGFRRIPKNGAFLATDLATISAFLNKSTADISGVVADDLGNE